MLKNLILVFFCLICLIIIPACTSEKSELVTEQDTSGADDSYLSSETKPPPELDSDQAGANDKKKPRVYKRPKNTDEKTTSKPNQDVKLRKLLTEINIAINFKNYLKANNLYRSARKYLTENESLKNELKQAGKRIQPYIAAFKNVLEIKYRNDLERIYLNNTQGFLGSVIEDNKAKNYLVIQDIVANSFVKINYSDIAKRENVSSAEQKTMLKEEFEEMSFIFDEATPDSIVYLQQAKLAWRYGQKNEAYQNIEKALKLNDELVRQTIMLEADKDFAIFQEALKVENFEAAKKMLAELMSKYPRAEIFRKAAEKINKHFEKTEELEEKQKKEIADEIVKKSKQDEKEFSDELDDKTEKPVKPKASKKTSMPKVDPTSELIKEKLLLPVGELLAEAEKEYNTALNFDRSSRPGAPEAAKNLDLAIYHYQIAKKLYEGARDKGAEIGTKMVEINKALFWCRKRHTF